MKFIDKILLKTIILATFPPFHCEMTSKEAQDFIKKVIDEMPVFDTDKFIDEIKTDSSVKLYGSNNSGNYLIPVKRVEEILKSKLEG